MITGIDKPKPCYLVRISTKCSECQCTARDCRDFECSACTKDVCCCLPRKEHSVYRFFQTASKLYPTALAIEILCICAAELGENSSFLVLFRYRTAIGITLGYILGIWSICFYYVCNNTWPF
jgi:hypothetical protein